MAWRMAIVNRNWNSCSEIRIYTPLPSPAVSQEASQPVGYLAGRTGTVISPISAFSPLPSFLRSLLPWFPLSLVPSHRSRRQRILWHFKRQQSTLFLTLVHSSRFNLRCIQCHRVDRRPRQLLKTKLESSIVSKLTKSSTIFHV